MAHAQKIQITQWFSGESFEMQIWDEGCRVCDLLLVDGGLTGWFSKNVNYQPLWFQPVWSLVLVLSLKLPSSTWIASPSSCRATQRYISQCFFYFPSEGTRTLLYTCIITSWLLFLCSCFPKPHRSNLI